MENRRVQQYGRTGRASGSIGFSLGKGKWNARTEPVAAGVETELSLSLLGQHDDVAGCRFPRGGSKTHIFLRACGRNVLVRRLPVKPLADGTAAMVVSVYDLVLAGGVWAGSWSGLTAIASIIIAT